jgi:hypothetical protein
MKPGLVHTLGPLQGTVDGTPIQTPSQAKYGLGGGFIYSYRCRIKEIFLSTPSACLNYSALTQREFLSQISVTVAMNQPKISKGGLRPMQGAKINCLTTLQPFG